MFLFPIKEKLVTIFKAHIKRIYPTFILVIILTLITNGILFKEWPNAHQCVISLSGFSYFINGNLETWYISAILILYCISPYYSIILNLNSLYGFAYYRMQYL